MMSKARTILDLDDYSLRRVFSSLSKIEKVTVGYACQRFQSIVGPLIGEEEIHIFDYEYSWDIGNPKQFFPKYGVYVKKAYIRYKNDENEFFDIVLKHCHNIEEVRVHFPQNVDTETVKNMFCSNKNLKKLISCAVENWTDVESDHISTLENLETLHLDHSPITGEHLNRLTNLRELNLEHCKKLDSKHFVAICKANRLLRLNISGCDRLNAEAFRTLVETQTELDEILVDHWYKDGEVEQVALLKNLRRFLIRFNPDYNGRPTNLLRELSKHCSSSLKVLAILGNATTNMRSEDLKRIPSFQNLEELILVEVRNLSDSDLDRISKACKQLQKLDLPSCNRITNKGVLQIISNLKCLNYLSLEGCSQLGRELYQKMCNAKRTLDNNIKLTVFIDEPSILNYVSDEQYTTNQRLIKILCHCGPFNVYAWRFIYWVEQMDAYGLVDI